MRKINEDEKLKTKNQNQVMVKQYNWCPPSHSKIHNKNVQEIMIIIINNNNYNNNIDYYYNNRIADNFTV